MARPAHDIDSTCPHIEVTFLFLANSPYCALSSILYITYNKLQSTLSKPTPFLSIQHHQTSPHPNDPMADNTQQEMDTAPDPEEDDLDDLDGPFCYCSSSSSSSVQANEFPADVLDEFDSKPNLPAAPKPSASGPGRPPPQARPTGPDVAVEDADAPEEDDLAAQLQAGMGSLISELGENPEMQKQFEAMMQELIAAGNASSDDVRAAEHVKRASDSMPKDPEEEKSKEATGKKEDSFQETIRKTMERMQQSGDAATAAAAGGDKEKSEEEMLMEMLKSMGTGEGGGGEEDFNSMLMSMMTQLVNKDILYEPMKELDTKFPAWMEKNKDGGVKKEDLARYREQERLVREIVLRFERKEYSDDNEDDREYIVERMQKVSPTNRDLGVVEVVLMRGGCCRCKKLVRRRRISWAI